MMQYKKRKPQQSGLMGYNITKRSEAGAKEPLWRRTPDDFAKKPVQKTEMIAPKEKPVTNMERIMNGVLSGAARGGVSGPGADAKKEYVSRKTKEFQGHTSRYVDDLFSDKTKPSEGITGSAEPGDRFRYTDGDLADPFTQGLFGEKDLRNEFLRRQTEIFQPRLEQAIARMEKEPSGAGFTVEKTPASPLMAQKARAALPKTQTDSLQKLKSTPAPVLPGGGLSTGVQKDRDANNDFAAAGLGHSFGMKLDEETGMVYHSKGEGGQKMWGYNDWYDGFSKLIFDLESPKTKATYVDAEGKEKKVEHRIWMGDYLGGWLASTPSRLGTKAKGEPLNSYYGGESSILFSDPADKAGWYQDKDAFEQSITVKDASGNEMLHFDSADMYEDKTSDWAFACKMADSPPAQITGQLRGADKAALEAISGGQSKDGIVYGDVRWNRKDGKYYLDWSFSSQKG